MKISLFSQFCLDNNLAKNQIFQTSKLLMNKKRDRYIVKLVTGTLINKNEILSKGKRQKEERVERTEER